jgi:membrane fusion protein, multidrug efflux system
MKHLAAWTAGSIGVVIAVTLGVLAASDNTAEAQKANPRLVKASDCTVQLIDIATLAAERSGILESDTPEEGVLVRAGQNVVGLKDGLAKATYEKERVKAKNDVHVRYAEKSAQYADADLARSLEANRNVPGTVPQSELAKQELAAQKAVLQIEQAEFEQSIAELTVNENLEALKTYRVIAPFDGFVSKVYLRKGEAVQLGTPILEVRSTARVKIEGYVSIPDSYRIKAGDTVHVQLDADDFDIPLKDVILPGKVKYIDSDYSPIIGKVKIYAEVPNPRAILRSGLNARMTITPSPPISTVGTRK